MASSGAESRSPRAREIVAAARRILERDGSAGLSMRAIADEVGIRAPSLYKHFPDKEALEVAVISDGLAEIADVFERAVRETDEPLASIAAAYRAWALRHPHLYRLMMERPLPRERLTPGVEERASAVVVAAAGGDPDAARAVFAFAHGMVILELNDRFPTGADLDAAWRTGVDAFVSRGPSPARRSPRRGGSR